MKIVIVGAGEVGSHLSEVLSLADHDVTVVERDATHAQTIHELMDVRIINESGSSSRTLKKAGVENCDLFLAMTSNDETNLVSSSLAKALGATTTFARVHDTTFRDTSVINYQSHFSIDHLVNPEALAAVELAMRIRNPGRVAVEDFGRGKIEVQSLVVRKNAKAIGIPIKDLNLPGTLRIGTIKRGDETTIAHAHSILKEADQITLFGHPNSLFETKSLFDPESKPSKRIGVTLLSGSEISISLIRLLSNPRFRIRVIEKSLSLCRSLSEKFPKVTFIHGEGTSLRLLEEEEIGSSDYFIACSKDDESNIMTCLQAQKLGAKHAMLAINRTDYIEVMETLRLRLGLETAVSPRTATANEILRHTGEYPYIELEQGDKTTNCIIEISVGTGSIVSNKKIREINWPNGCIIVGLESNHDPKMPTGDDVIKAGDSIIAIVSKSNLNELLKLAR